MNKTSLTLTIKNNLVSELSGETNLLMNDSVGLEHHENKINITINNTINAPIYINYQDLDTHNSSLSHPVVSINLKTKTKAFLVENFESSDISRDKNKIHTKLNLEPDSNINYVRHTNLHPKTSFSHICNIKIKKQAQVNFYDIHSHQGNFTSESHIKLEEKHAIINYFGLDKLNTLATQHNILEITHDAPNTKSNQEFRGIYENNSVGSFQGKVIINKQAQKSSAYQLYKALLLDPRAQAHVEPHMEIYNSDIKASHGATIGALDPEALFYLQSRGLDKKHAREILVQAFTQAILDNLPTKNIKNFFLSNSNHA